MDTLNTSSSASNIQPPTNVTSNVQNNANIKNGLPKTNVSSSGQDEDQKRLNGFFNEENAGKKSDILRPKNNSQGQAATNVLGKWCVRRIYLRGENCGFNYFTCISLNKRFNLISFVT